MLCWSTSRALRPTGSDGRPFDEPFQSTCVEHSHEQQPHGENTGTIGPGYEPIASGEDRSASGSQGPDTTPKAVL